MCPFAESSPLFIKQQEVLSHRFLDHRLFLRAYDAAPGILQSEAVSPERMKPSSPGIDAIALGSFSDVFFNAGARDDAQVSADPLYHFDGVIAKVLMTDDDELGEVLRLGCYDSRHDLPKEGDPYRALAHGLFPGSVRYVRGMKFAKPALREEIFDVGRLSPSFLADIKCTGVLGQANGFGAPGLDHMVHGEGGERVFEANGLEGKPQGLFKTEHGPRKTASSSVHPLAHSGEHGISWRGRVCPSRAQLHDIPDKFYGAYAVTMAVFTSIHIPQGNALHAEVFVQRFVNEMDAPGSGQGFPYISGSAAGQAAYDSQVVIVKGHEYRLEPSVSRWEVSFKRFVPLSYWRLLTRPFKP
jgi:hypothetical protein